MPMRRLLTVSLIALAAQLPLHAADDDLVWVEGEEATTSEVTPHPWYSEAITRDALSGGAWLSQFTDKGDGMASYDITVPKDGEWTLWARINPIQAKLAYKVGTGEWKEADTSKVVDQVNIANDNKPDMRFVAWAKLEKIPLKAGKTTVAFKFHSDNMHHGGLDCFLLTTKNFLPNGSKNPGSAKASAATDPTAYVWVEGEDAVSSNAKPHSWYSEAIKRDMLSGDGWLSTFDGPEEVIAKYDVTMAKAGSYALWLRMNPIAAKVAWRVGDGAWTEVDAGKALDQVNLANDGKPDLRFVAWVNGGKVEVPAGKISVEIKFHSEVNHHGALDCFVLAAKTFNPNGKTKPGTKLGGADAGWWSFEPEQDEFTPESKLTLRGLNEKRAGEKGSLKTTGSEITLGDGTPVRFWAVNAGAPADQGQADYLAARLAKNGFNLTRIHGGVFDRSGTDPKAVDMKHLDAIHYAVKAYAEQGIYVHLSTYFPLWLQLKDSDGITDGPIGKNPFALLLIDSKFQDMYKAWMKTQRRFLKPFHAAFAADFLNLHLPN